MYVSVILELAIQKTLDYAVPEAFRNSIAKGSRVSVPVRGIPRIGYVFALKDTPEVPKVRDIAEVLSPEPLLTPELFELAIWMASYYCAPIAHVLKTILPSSVRGKAKEKQQLYVMRAKTRDVLAEMCAEMRRKSPAQADVLDVMLQVRKGMLLTELLEEAETTAAAVKALEKKGLLQVDIVRVDRSPLVNEDYIKTKAKVLTGEQGIALERIASAVVEDRFETHLLHGVTGSGKTEVYLQAIDRALSQGKGSIVLVPEISLTPQTVERFRSRFDDHIAVLHHRLSHGERHDEWHRIYRGEARIVIGPRSAIFCPVNNLGVIIVDEEHEASYKQSETAPCYHARDIAVMRGKLSSCPVVLGSATPSLESYHNASSGKYILSTLKNRADSASIPTVTIIDMATQRESGTFSQPLVEAIRKRHQAGEQTILFLNRRGYHTTLLCQDCSNVVECPRCDVALTFHKDEKHLCCHLCGHNVCPPPSECPKCHRPTMKFRGIGTQQVEKALHAIFPEIRSIRVDADTTKHKGSHQKLLREFGTGKADVLIGTQMIAKGLHFPQVTLVGIMNSDGALNIPDFRASETVFQLITQVSGRSGRGAMAGEVIIQTMIPENRTIQLASRQDFETFFSEEMEVRKMFEYPPYTQMAKVLFTGPSEKIVVTEAQNYREQLVQRLSPSFEVYPVLPAGHAKIKDQFRQQFLVRGPKGTALSKALEDLKKTYQVHRDIKVLVDINPLSTYF
ncbi:MAG: primosomal protein N' [Chlamydiales bacterium]|nr:primosomal protein N' [Chlamydiales bacterium]